MTVKNGKSHRESIKEERWRRSSDYMQAEWELYHLKLMAQIRAEMERTAAAAELSNHAPDRNRTACSGKTMSYVGRIWTVSHFGQGWVPLRRGIMEHVYDGRLTPVEHHAFVSMLLLADAATGTWRHGSAPALRHPRL